MNKQLENILKNLKKELSISSTLEQFCIEKAVVSYFKNLLTEDLIEEANKEFEKGDVNEALKDKYGVSFKKYNARPTYSYSSAIEALEKKLKEQKKVIVDAKTQERKDEIAEKHVSKNIHKKFSISI